jgi:hypothetical protein
LFKESTVEATLSTDGRRDQTSSELNTEFALDALLSTEGRREPIICELALLESVLSTEGRRDKMEWNPFSPWSRDQIDCDWVLEALLSTEGRRDPMPFE